nr:hypothetical protein HK105_005851 [Polyrhizophydium stewartii]
MMMLFPTTDSWWQPRVGLAVAALAVVLTAGVSGYLAMPKLRSQRKRDTRSLPRDAGLPLVGRGLAMLESGLRLASHEFAEDAVRRVGPTHASVVFGEVLVFTIEADLIHRALTDTESFERTDFFQQSSEGFNPLALFALPSGEVWKRHRKLVQPAFGPTHIRHAAAVTSGLAHKLVQHLLARTAASPHGCVVVDLFEEASALSIDVIGLVGFSHEFNALDDLHKNIDNEARSALNILAAAVEKVGVRLLSPPKSHQRHLGVLTVVRHVQRFYTPRFLWGLFGLSSSSRTLRKAVAFFKDKLNVIIKARRAALAGKAAPSVGTADMDIVDRLILGDGAGGARLDENEIIDEAIGLFAAGQELLDAVFKESLRLMPPAEFLARRTTREIIHNGRVIPAKTDLMLMIGGMQRCTKYWFCADEFIPERWLAPEPPGTAAFMPFGGGPMNCIGQKLATIEAKIVLASLVSSFAFEVVKEQDLRILTSITTGFKGGLLVRLTPRGV